MINIKIIIKYGKLISLFILLELLISFITGFLNLIGVKSFITTFIIIVSNTILYSTCGYIMGKSSNKKGIITGLITAISLIITSIIITLILFGSLNFKSIIYYIVLLFITTIASTIGKNKKEGSTSNKE